MIDVRDKRRKHLDSLDDQQAEQTVPSESSGSVSIKEITKQWLKANGYDGLYNCDGCGCGLADFMPCGFPNENECVAAHKRDDGFFYKGKPND